MVHRLNSGILAVVVVAALGVWLWVGAHDPINKAFEKISSGEYPGAFKELLVLSENNLPEADYALGWFYRRGWVGAVDAPKASFYFNRAKQGFLQNIQSKKDLHVAAFYLGVMAEHGLGGPQDLPSALRWYQVAAEQGDPYAQLNLGNLYLGARGIPQQDTMAVSWYRKAAEGGGDPRAMINLGCLLAQGRGTPEDDQGAITWFQRANTRVRGLARTHIMVMRDKEPMMEQMLPLEEGHIFHHVVDDTARLAN